MTLVSLGVFLLLQVGVVVTIVGAATRTRPVLLIGLLVLLAGVGLILGIRNACAGSSGC